ncbi:hypothetical protein A3H22_02325 [Candidatus Peribacteria bacterium RIFCSPLOWO2_12_FULL_55_15]|nr:MAG: hypothetical protein A2789_01580 [Candidatus Peribacteria bacterium RIFCSPHIGHO2_01_FULL_54_22]OGJ62871.1 MAG: hypothetical protein A3D12_00975 [Candidatus Peribacteria bacterium RIFCSPHIGHO2_02_FULL_55_24]OGJ67865.1 MAG: hypothetical protein A2947_03150 [Candidatus Peribacteria bacterium RIFCSPLOWO2_01_FULL_54_110]OGJ69204.1 MAG: hypothetical protein A3H90_00105 [Candidatus Peribacteria bacterium RIFCSPLOWO2_02_FULL_55_36]OGJ70502.1 MAG: hypothetical protein A3H22_02325 [Candidatus Per
MDITSYQIVAPLVSVVSLVYAWNLWYRQKKTLWEAALWTLFWASIALIAFYPDILTYLTAATGIKDQVNAILVTCIGILFFMVFYMIMRLEEMEQRQVRLIRAMALREAGLSHEDGERGKERVG